SFVVAKLLVAGVATLACVYLFLIVGRTHDEAFATGAVLLFGLAPLVVSYSQHVVLEVPTLALGLMTTFHFLRFLEAGGERRAKGGEPGEKSRGTGHRDWLPVLDSPTTHLFIAALAAAGAALTRFDAAYLLPLLVGLIAVRRRWDVLKRPAVWAA